MSSESRLDRSLWTIVLLAAIALVLASFAQKPLFGGDGEASGFGRPLTLWVASGESNSQTSAVAHQVAACWNLNGRAVSVGVLPGSPTSAVVDFLSNEHHNPDELLVVTSTTLADIAQAQIEATVAEARERAHQAAALLTSAPSVALIGNDPLTVAVRSSSMLRNTSQLLELLREEPTQPLVGVAESSWVKGYLATLAQTAGVQGRMPFSAFRSSREAAASLGSASVRVVLVPHSSVVNSLREGSLRSLSWPGAHVPRAWLALIAPRGVEQGQLTALRRQASALCTHAIWGRLLRSDGLTPAIRGSHVPADFFAKSLSEATRLQYLAARLVHEY